MRIRRTDASGEPRFGGGQADYHHDTPEAVAECIRGRLSLMAGEWFLDTAEGTPYYQKVVGYNTAGLYDVAIKDRILGSRGMRSVIQYESRRDSARNLAVTARVDTIFGPAALTVGV